MLLKLFLVKQRTLGRENRQEKYGGNITTGNNFLFKFLHNLLAKLQLAPEYAQYAQHTSYMLIIYVCKCVPRNEHL